MKKIFLLLLVTCSVGLTSCSSDDNDAAAEAAKDSNGNTIVGHWTMTELTTNSETGESTTKTQDYIFQADKTGSYKRTKTGEEDQNISLTWSKSADAYTMTGGGDTSEPFTIGDSSDGTKALIDSDGDIMALKE